MPSDEALHQDQALFKVAETTRDRWTSFQPYLITRRGECNVPIRYLKEAVGVGDIEDPGYQVPLANRPSHWYNVEFNHVAKCWCEVLPNDLRGVRQWNVVQPCESYYGCDILVSELVSREEEGPIDGENPSETSEDGQEEIEPQSDAPRGNESPNPIIQHITSQLAESHIESEIISVQPMATATMEEIDIAVAAPIDPITGHRNEADAIAIQRALLPDQPDPPSDRGGSIPPGGVPFHYEDENRFTQPRNARPPTRAGGGGGGPAGRGGGGGFPARGGGGGGGPPPAGGGPIAGGPIAGGGDNKLIGN